MCVRAHARVPVCVCTYAYVCTYVCTYVCAYACVRACTHTCICVYVCVCVCVCVYVRMCMDLHVYVLCSAMIIQLCSPSYFFCFTQLSRALVRNSEDGSLSPADYRVSKR